MKAKIKDIVYWVRHDGKRGILAHEFPGIVFVSEDEIEKKDFEGVEPIVGLPAEGAHDDEPWDYTYDNPMDVVYADYYSKDGLCDFLVLEKRWQSVLSARLDEAYRQLVLHTGWKSDWLSERTKMLRRIDECRDTDTPCGFLRKEWEDTVNRIKNLYDDEDYQGAVMDMFVEWGCDFFDLVEEVESWYEDDKDDEDDN